MNLAPADLNSIWNSILEYDSIAFRIVLLSHRILLLFAGVLAVFYLFCRRYCVYNLCVYDAPLGPFVGPARRTRRCLMPFWMLPICR